MSDEEVSSHSDNKLGLSGPQIVGSALAAITSAVVLSTLGTVGTIIGAAAGSIVLTVADAAYTRYIRIGKDRLRVASETARDRMQQVRPRPQGNITEKLPRRDRGGEQETESENAATIHDPAVGPDDNEARADEDSADDDAAGERSRWQETMRQLPWKRIAVVSAALFVVVMVVIVVFELSVGRSVSSFTGGSSADGSRSSIPFFGNSSSHNGNDGGHGSDSNDGDDGSGQRQDPERESTGDPSPSGTDSPKEPTRPSPGDETQQPPEPDQPSQPDEPSAPEGPPAE